VVVGRRREATSGRPSPTSSSAGALDACRGTHAHALLDLVGGGDRHEEGNRRLVVWILRPRGSHRQAYTRVAQVVERNLLLRTRTPSGSGRTASYDSAPPPAGFQRRPVGDLVVAAVRDEEVHRRRALLASEARRSGPAHRELSAGHLGSSSTVPGRSGAEGAGSSRCRSLSCHGVSWRRGELPSSSRPRARARTPWSSAACCRRRAPRADRRGAPLHAAVDERLAQAAAEHLSAGRRPRSPGSARSGSGRRDKRERR
jgi:hypothetical protein